MSSPFQYFGTGTHMSAVLKRDTHRVLTKRPELLKTQLVRESSMDGDGKVTVTVTKTTRAMPLSGARRHALSLQMERY